MASQEQSRRPADTPFKQQKLKAWQPILTPKWVILTFMCVGIVFLPIGIAVLVASQQIVEFTYDYTDCTTIDSSGTGGRCSVAFTLPKDMPNPVYMYYQLSNFYQNHRRYVQSRSDPQLRGSILSDSTKTYVSSDVGSQLTECSPADAVENTDSTKYYWPCGLVARSWFNDTFSLRPSNGSPLTPDTNPSFNDKTGLAWPSDIDKKFAKPDPDWMKKNCYQIGPDQPLQHSLGGFTDIQIKRTDVNPAGVFKCWHNVSDEKFIVWMRTAGLPEFKKLYAKLDKGPLTAGQYILDIAYNFPVTPFNGKKSFVLSTTKWIGGKNNFLGIAYIVVGSLCILMGVIFLIKHLVSPRTLGDVQYLVWKP